MLTIRFANGRVVIPVFINIWYKTAAKNISNAQIQSQIDVLNKDFTATDSDFKNIPAQFASLSTNVAITFELVNAVRKPTTKTSWRIRDSNKNIKRRGINLTSLSATLKIWACKIGRGILDYAQFPGGCSANDKVIIDSNYFGLSSATSYLYNLGRTASHKVVHWKNLSHICGGTYSGNDLVSDKPVHKTANFDIL